MAEDTDRTVVKTYIPRQQKEEWKAHADQLGMTQSEFVRSMVQAGRRGFGEMTEETTNPTPDESLEGADTDETPGVEELEDRVLEVLETGTHSWDELVDAVVGDLEAELDQTLQTLQTAGRIRYSGKADGYVLVES